MVLLPMSSPFSRGLHFCRMRRTSYTMDGFCLLYLLMILLMRSGDVETNPGPNTSESTVSEMEFLKLAQDIPPSYYNVVGSSLGIPYAQLQSILSEELNYTHAFLHIFMKWNAMEQPPHWNKRQLLADKLREIDLGGLSDIILNGPQIPNITELTEASLGNTISTSPRQSPSTLVDTPPQGASAAVSEVSTSTAREVSNAMLNKLARQIPSDHYDTFSEKLGIERNEARNIVVKYQSDYEKATRECIAKWRDRSTRSVADLHGVLRAADLGGLIVYSTEDEYKKTLADEIAKRLTVTPPQDQESLEPHSDTTRGRGLKPEEEDSIPFTMVKKTEETTEPARHDTPSASGQTSSHTHGFNDVIIKVADNISDDGDLRRLGIELGVQIPVINHALETNWVRGIKTSNGNVMMLQNWAETVKSSKLIQTLRAALNRAGLLEVEETCFTSSSREDEYSKALADEIAKRLIMTPPQDQESLEPHSDTTVGRGLNPEEEDDNDNNGGNDDQLTSLQHDSGSNLEYISFGGLSAPPEILARGPRARQAYAEAAQAGTKKVFRTRLMLVGQERVGKTSLKKTLTGQGFDQNEAITDGVETTSPYEISIEIAKADEKEWSIHKNVHGNEDTKEDEYNTALADEIAKRLIMTPTKGQESFEPHSRGLNPEEAEDKYSKSLENEQGAQKLIVTPQQDQESLEPHSDTALSRGLNSVEAEEFVLDNVEKILKEKVRLKEMGTDSTDSARQKRVSISIWDFAGHDIYYTTHQVFLTWRAIYVIVFDLSRSLDSVVPHESRDENFEMAKGGAKSELTWLEFINFWLCSIYAHAVAPSSVIDKNTSKSAQKSPPIFIVGTHRESVKGDAKEKEKKIKSAFEKIRKSIEKKPFECHVVRKDYAIENSLEDKDGKLVALRKHIEKVARNEPYMGEEIPLRWLLFEEALAADKINYMSLDQTKELTQPVGMESERELLTMLTFYHDLGYIVYYGGIEDQQSLLRDMVILNPQWLIDVFKQVITILDPEERDGIVSDAWTTLEKDGILEDRLIQHMWKDFLEQKEALVKLMTKFDLICEAPVERLQQEQQDGVDTEVSNETEKVVKKRYYVPSRLKSQCSPELAEEIAQIKSSTDFYVDFKGFLPNGLFHRLMTRAVRWMGERDGQPVDLFYRQISLMFDEKHQALLEMLPPREATIKVTVYRGVDANSEHDGDSHKPPAPIAVKEVMDFVTGTLDSLIQHWAMRIKYDVLFLCPRCSEKKQLKDCFTRKSLKCKIHYISTAEIKKKFGMSEEGVESGNKNATTSKESNVLCDRYFSNLAMEIGAEWEQLGYQLLLSKADIEHIRQDKQIAVDCICAVLQLWKNRSSCKDKRKMVEELCKALSSCKRRDLAEKVKEAAGIR